MYRSVRSEYFVAACLTACILAGWLFYGFGLDTFLHAAYHGESLNYFNEFAARWRDRQSSPSFQVFLQDAHSLLFRLGVLGTFVASLLVGGILGFPNRVRHFFSAKTSPYNLAIVRIILFGTLLSFDLSTPSSYAQLPTSLQFPPRDCRRSCRTFQ